MTRPWLATAFVQAAESQFQEQEEFLCLKSFCGHHAATSESAYISNISGIGGEAVWSDPIGTSPSSLDCRLQPSFFDL